ncbi:MAG: hypothetical protein V2J55_20900, partial [Candidatus Competibacteraceae bacterium]|nr:hypothetical protein [Candidatus Competibacteraceae bacterium]
RPPLDDRRALMGIIFVLKTGIPWNYAAQKSDRLFAQITAQLLGKERGFFSGSFLLEAVEWAVLAVCVSRSDCFGRPDAERCFSLMRRKKPRVTSRCFRMDGVTRGCA